MSQKTNSTLISWTGAICGDAYSHSPNMWGEKTLYWCDMMRSYVLMSRYSLSAGRLQWI